MTSYTGAAVSADRFEEWMSLGLDGACGIEYADLTVRIIVRSVVPKRFAAARRPTVFARLVGIRFILRRNRHARSGNNPTCGGDNPDTFVCPRLIH
jgi:hypothetical protein